MGLIPGGVLMVTGAASGMGREVAIGFAKEGASAMVLGDINEAGLIATAEMIKSQSPSVMVVTMTLDVSSPENVQQFVDQLVTKFGRLDYAVNAAGIAPAPNELTDAPSNSLARSLNVNTKGVFFCCQAQIRQMIRQEPRKGSQCRGSIINITSLAGHGGAYAQLPAYTMSKACPESLTRSIAQETGAQGIRINTVAPGFTLTPMLQGHAAQETLDQIATLVPMRRLGTSQDIANACLLLSSPYAEYIHGQSLAVDGGLSLEHYC